MNVWKAPHTDGPTFIKRGRGESNAGAMPGLLGQRAICEHRRYAHAPHLPLSTLPSNRRSLVFIYMHTNLRLLLLAVICFFVEASQLSSAGLRPIEHCVSTRWGYSCFAPETRGALMRMPGRRIITGYLRVGSRGILAASCCWLAREIMRDVYTYGETFVERCRRDPHVLVFEAVADDTEQRSAT